MAHVGVLRAVVLVAGSLAMMACSGIEDRPREPAAAERFVAVRNDAVAGTASRRTLGFGEDCSALGNRACKSELAVHLKPLPNDGWVCTKSCETDADCEKGWVCTRVGALGEQRCVPPAGWLLQLRSRDGGVR